jgi:hypothetical protein
MMPAGVQAEHLNVQHVGEPGQGVPICFFLVFKAEAPGDAAAAQPGSYIRIVGDIEGIIEPDESKCPTCPYTASVRTVSTRQIPILRLKCGINLPG